MNKPTGMICTIWTFLIFSTFPCFSQNTFDPLSVPPEESGISIEEYNDLKKNKTIVEVPSTEGILTLELIKVQKSGNDVVISPKVTTKNNPNKPQQTPLTEEIIREEDCNEN